ncbi:RHS repeat-associated core domain-containing protein [Actinoplanes subglobosus]|uniref:RHS repeat-associated core domain-containing protein n=1 Tax=Actinoplanes subglobosus TaxID=1547892 RepID=A0ABV8IKP7_9ACTN
MLTTLRGTWRRRGHRLFVGSLVNALVLSGLTVPVSAAALAAPSPQPAAPAAEKLDNHGGPVRGKAWAQSQVRSTAAPAPVWPKPTTARVDLASAAGTRSVTAARRAKAGDLPVWVADAPGTTRSGSRLSRLDVQVVDRSGLPVAWREALMLKVTAPQGAATGNTRLSVDYRSFGQAYGADWASRLKLWQVPRCALTTPAAAACQSKPLPSDVDHKAGTVSATVPVTATATTATASVAASGAMVALMAAPSGDTGDFTATSLAPSSTWSAGGNSGAFSWNYPMRVPPATGPNPDVAFSYSSAAVDGRSEATNNQPSWVGEGFDYTPGYIERRYVPCYQDSDPATNPNSTKSSGDLCWRSDNAVVSLGGSSTELVYDKAKKEWRSRVEDGSKIEKRVGAANGDTGTADIDGVGEHWRIVTTDGTQYFFGLDDLPGETTATNSTQTVPVFGNHTGEPCRQSTFMASDCVQAYRWNLDYVVDVRGNTMSYWYRKETNKYAQNATDNEVVTYDRAAYLGRIDYGTYDRTQAEHGKTERNVEPYAQVVFTPDIRCFTTNCGTDTAPVAENWKDTPWDQECKASATTCPAQYSPTFWTAKRLKTITTRVWDTTRATPDWQAVDSWTLTHTDVATADTANHGLWLQRIDHAGLVKGQINLPPVTFAGVSLPNRVLTENTTTYNWPRLASIVTETGAKVKIDYSDVDCTETIIATLEAHTNTRRCYPVKVPSNADPTGDVMVEEWWHKYVVTHIAEDDMQTSGSHSAPSRHTRYTYDGDPAWHYADDDGLTQPNRRTWDQWRGYQTVRTTIGDEPDTRTLTVTKFLRGMHGDRAAPSGGTRPPVIVSASLGPETVHDHDQFAGLIREQTTYNGVDTKPVSRTVNVPWRSPPTATRDDIEARYVNTQVTYTATALGTDGSRGWRTSGSRSDFDDTYGTVNWTQGDGDITKTDDETCVTYTYNRNTAKNLTAVVSRSLTTALSCAKTATNVDDVIGDSRNYYDGADSLTTPPRFGSPTKAEQLKDWTPSTGTVWQTTSEATYDEAGRSKTSKDIRGNTTRTDYTPTVGGPVTRLTTTNSLSWVSSVEMNPYWGSITKSTDVNGQITADVDYDVLGRVVRAWNLGWTRAASATKPSAQYEYAIAANRDAYPYIKSQTLNAAGNYVTTYQISDALLRPRQTQTLSLGGSGDRVVTDILYDEFGRAATAYGTHAEPGAPSGALWFEPEWSVPAVTKTVFDRASRPTTSTFLSGDNVTNLVPKWKTVTAHEGDLTKITPPAGGTPTTTVTDIYGHTVALRQHTTAAGVAGAYTETTYTYDRKGQQTKVTDADGNQWTSTYDAKGRVDATTDPDKGAVDFAYNDKDELESTTDARNEKLWYNYDSIGRKKEVRDDSKDGPLRAAWTYDTLYGSQSSNFKGQVTESIRYEPAGSANAYKWQARGINARYQPTGVNYVIPEAETGLAGTYIYAFGYSEFTGAPTTMSYPAAGGLVTEELTTAYNASTGMPARLDTNLTGWAGTMATTTYTAYGERSGSVYKMPGGKFVQDLVYREEGSRRLTRTSVLRETVAGTVSDRWYYYDESGNILSTEERPAVGTYDKQCFRTDLLGRLTTAWTPKEGVKCGTDPTLANLGGPAPYWQDWTFTTTGSRKTETSYTAGGNTVRDYTIPTGGASAVRPHAVTSMTTKITGQADATAQYRYDNSGNTICRPAVGATTNNCDTKTNSQTLNWNAEGELATVTAGASTIEASVYDANGERLIRRDTTGTTLYLPGQEIRREGTVNTGTRYYDFAGTTFASRTTSSAITNLTWLFNDHQGTQQIALNAGTQAVSLRRQTPYGSERGTNPIWVNKKTFVGGDQDPNGLVNIGARRYDPLLGRFISVDPLMNLADPQHWNGYSYANNDPVNKVDPDGLEPRPWHDPNYSNTKACDGDFKNSQECNPAGPEVFKIGLGGQPETQNADKDHNGSISRSEAPKGLDMDQLVAEEYQQYCYQFGPNGCRGFEKLTSDDLEEFTANVTPYGDARDCWNGDGWSCAGLAVSIVPGAGKGIAWLAKAARRGKKASKAPDASDVSDCFNSFSDDTRVLMADGSAKEMHDIEVGDHVESTDPETGKKGPREVEAVWEHNDDLYVMYVDGSRLITTEDHPFWNETDKQWQEASRIDPGDLVRTPTGTARIAGFDRSAKRYAAAYNLTVVDIHTYYVLAGTTPVLVHNCPTDGVGSSGRVSSQVAAHLERLKGVAGRHNLTVAQMGDGVLWANKNDNFNLMTPKQLDAVKSRFSREDVQAAFDYYNEVRTVSPNNPSAHPRAELMSFYLENWGG